MAQSTHIAAGQSELAGTATEGTSGRLTFSLDAAEAIPGNITIPIYLEQGARKEFVIGLSALYRKHVIDGPGAFFAERPDISAYGVDVAVLVDGAAA